LIAIAPLCADSATLRYLLEALAQAYLLAEPDESGEDILQYADFTAWQIETLEIDCPIQAKDYWQKQTRQKTRLELKWLERTAESAIMGSPAVPQTIGARQDVVGQLQTLAERHHSSVESILLTSWFLFLWRLSNSSDITVGLLAQGRDVSEPQKLLGPVARCLLLSLQVERLENALQVLKRVDELLSEAREWEVYFDPVQRQEDDSARIALSSIPVAFAYGEWPGYEADGLVFSFISQNIGTEPADLLLLCDNTQQSLHIGLQYNPAIYSKESIAHLLEYYQVLLQDMLRDITASPLQLRLAGDADLVLLQKLSAVWTELPKDRLVHQLFEEQAARNPQALALIHEDEQFTYDDLNRRANQLSHFLRRHGAAPDVPVVLLAERSSEMIIGLLAILKAGSAYVPLNPAHPREFLKQHLSTTRAPLLLTQERHLQLLEDYKGLVFCLDRDGRLVSDESVTNPANVALPASLVYIIYTSGSTGGRKGVLLTHESLLNYVYALGNQLSLQKRSRPLHFAHASTIDADLGNTSIFLALTSGGCLHIVSYERATDGNIFADYLARCSIDVLKISPSHLNTLLSTTGKQALLPSTYLLIGGETLSFSLLKQIAALEGTCKVINHYGPTEATIGAVVCDLTTLQQPHGQTKTVPIGRPIENVELYILDQELQMVPIGLPGEIYLGGACLARGYLGQPDQTAERFIPNPFNKGVQTRLYRTGDLGRYLPDGNVEFLQRVDRQVKIHGFRVELDEIEIALRGHPGIRAAAVIVWEDPTGDKRLVAYLVLEDSQLREALLAEVLPYLKDCLPEYMLPSRIIPLEHLPLTLNGKLDYRALPAPDQVQPSLERTLIAPRTPSEEMVTSLMAQLLHLQQVSITDNFFELGGHSLLGMQLIARLRQAFQIELPVRLLFDHPVAEDLSLAILEQIIEQGSEEIAMLLQEVQEHE
ncbi:MAG TPA: amino acid adenylation domain-containing protein, partial [Ktedonobacteraceae bacterium]|nr:amino acid adenylation domain-containing protein [Ktedonobacteraceae bacterium]